MKIIILILFTTSFILPIIYTFVEFLYYLTARKELKGLNLFYYIYIRVLGNTENIRGIIKEFVIYFKYETE